jgi:hypothetical protein
MPCVSTTLGYKLPELKGIYIRMEKGGFVQVHHDSQRCGMPPLAHIGLTIYAYKRSWKLLEWNIKSC